MAYLGIVVSAGSDDRRVQGRHLAQRLSTPDHLVAWHHLVSRTVEVIDRQADLDEDCAAAAWCAGRAEQCPQRGQDALAPGKDRDDGRERADVMWCVFQKQIAFERRLRHQPELAGLEIFQTAVNEPRWHGAGTRAEVAFVGDQAADALCAQITKQACPIDASAKYNDVDLAGLGYGGDAFGLIR